MVALADLDFRATAEDAQKNGYVKPINARCQRS